MQWNQQHIYIYIYSFYPTNKLLST